MYFTATYKNHDVYNRIAKTIHCIKAQIPSGSRNSSKKSNNMSWKHQPRLSRKSNRQMQQQNWMQQWWKRLKNSLNSKTSNKNNLLFSSKALTITHQQSRLPTQKQQHPKRSSPLWQEQTPTRRQRLLCIGEEHGKQALRAKKKWGGDRGIKLDKWRQMGKRTVTRISQENKIKQDTNYYSRLSQLTEPVDISEYVNVVQNGQSRVVGFTFPANNIKTTVNQRWQHKINNRIKQK